MSETNTITYRPSQTDCNTCPLTRSVAPIRQTERLLAASMKLRDVARRIAKTLEYLRTRCERKKVEMLFARLKRIMKLDHLVNSTAGTADRLFAAEPTFSTESAGFSQMRQAAFGRFLPVTTGRKWEMTISKRELQNPANSALILIDHQPQMAFGVQ